MSIPAWRPLKDVPKDLSAYVDTDDGEQVAQWANGRWFYWGDERPRYLSEDTPSLPIASTLELDRAIQSEIARAFGELIQAMVDAEHYLSIRGPNASCDLTYADTADKYRSNGVRAFRRIIRTALGGRIPDEAK